MPDPRDWGEWIPRGVWWMWWITLKHIDRRTPPTVLQSVIYSKKCSPYWLHQICDLLCWLYRQAGEIYTVHRCTDGVWDAQLTVGFCSSLCAILTSECFLWLIRPMCYSEPHLTFTIQAVQNHFIPFLWERLSQGLSVPMLESCAKAFCEWISYY